jgi:general stress protein 26
MQLVEEADTAYLATLDEEGFPQVRAMLNLRFTDQFPALTGFMKKHVKDFETYFTTNLSSQKIRQIKVNSACSVYYNIGYNGLTLNGHIAVVEDPVIKAELWQDGWELYYPKGQQDAEYGVLKFTPATLRYFNNLAVTDIKL